MRGLDGVNKKIVILAEATTDKNALNLKQFHRG